MKNYEFILKFSLGACNLDSEAIADRLYQAGCDDGLVGTGLPEHVAIHFIRRSESAEKAIHSALNNVRSALPEARLIAVSPI
jgi:hypothetical protein